jgi:hypothetical protein
MAGLQKIKDIVIYKDENFNSFPNVIKKDNGEVLVAFRQAPDWQHRYGKVTHCDPASKAVYVTSRDNGETWDLKTTTLYNDYYYGIQDPCINLLKDGSVFCTYFTWKVFEEADVPDPIPGERKVYDRWYRRSGGVYSIRSNDGGSTWDEPIRIVDQGNCVRGNIVELDDGTILLPMYVHPQDHAQALVAETKDKGRTWETRSILATSKDCLFQEPNLYRTASGKLVAFIRSMKLTEVADEREKYPLFTCESYDEGKTWVNLTEHKIYSPSPFHALRLQSGQVLLTYGYRNMPGSGIRAYVLDSECSNIAEAEEVILRDDGLGFDIGYPTSVQLDNGDILITYYYYNEDKGVRYIAGTLSREV